MFIINEFMALVCTRNPIPSVLCSPHRRLQSDRPGGCLNRLGADCSWSFFRSNQLDCILISCFIKQSFCGPAQRGWQRCTFHPISQRLWWGYRGKETQHNLIEVAIRWFGLVFTGLHFFLKLHACLFGINRVSASRWNCLWSFSPCFVKKRT